MALREIVRQLGIHVGLFGRSAIQQEMVKIEKGFEKHREALAKTRTAYLFLAFGLLATGGLMSRFGRQLTQLSDKAIQAFQGVEFQAVIVTSLLGKTGEAIGQVSQQMLQLGRDTEFTALQAGSAMEELAAAGFSLNETIGGAGPVLVLATAGLTTVGDAARIAAGVFRGFGFEAETAAQSSELLSTIVTQLAQAANESAATMLDFGEALKFVGPAAETLGFQLEAVLSVLQVASDALIKGGIAGRALRQSFVQMARAIGIQTDTTRNLNEVIDELGLQFADQQGAILPLIDIIEQLEVALEGMGAAEQIAILRTLFGTRAVTLWAAVLGKGTEALRKRELALKASSAKEKIFNLFGREGTQILVQWRSEIGESESALDFLTEQMGLTLEVARDINDVITDSRFSLEEWTRIVSEASTATAIVRARLETLQGTMLLLQSSIDAMWVSVGQSLAPVLMAWNRALKIIVDLLAQMHPWLRFVVAAVLLLGGAFLTNVGQILMMVGSITLLIAALASLRGQFDRGITGAQLQAFAFAQLRLMALSTSKAVIRLSIATFRLVAPWAAIIGLFLIAEHLFRKGGIPALLLFLAAVFLILRRAVFRTAGGFSSFAAKVDFAKLKMFQLTRALFGGRVATALFSGQLHLGTAAVTLFRLAVRAAKAALKTFWPILLLGVAVAGILLLIKHWDELTGAVQGFFEWISKLFAPLQALAAFLIGPVVSALQVVAGWIDAIVGSVRWLIDNLIALGGWFQTLLGGSVIPEAVESGSTRIQKSLAGLAGDVRAEFGLVRPAAGTLPVAGGRTTIVQIPAITVTFSNVTFGGPGQMVTVDRVVRSAVKESLKQMETAIIKA